MRVCGCFMGCLHQSYELISVKYDGVIPRCDMCGHFRVLISENRETNRYPRYVKIATHYTISYNV